MAVMTQHGNEYINKIKLLKNEAQNILKSSIVSDGTLSQSTLPFPFIPLSSKDLDLLESKYVLRVAMLRDV